MKKIIALFVIMLAFSFNASAQQKKAAVATTQQPQVNQADVKKYADKDMKMLHELVSLTNDQKKGFQTLFERKHSMLLQHPNFSQERKTILAESIETKLKSAMTPDQVAKLENNPKVLEALIN